MASRTVGRLEISLWLGTVFRAYRGRSATEATVEPSATKRRNQEVKIPDELAGFYRAVEWGREGYPMGGQKRKRERGGGTGPAGLPRSSAWVRRFVGCCAVRTAHMRSGFGGAIRTSRWSDSHQSVEWFAPLHDRRAGPPSSISDDDYRENSPVLVRPSGAGGFRRVWHRFCSASFRKGFPASRCASSGAGRSAISPQSPASTIQERS